MSDTSADQEEEHRIILGFSLVAIGFVLTILAAGSIVGYVLAFAIYALGFGVLIHTFVEYRWAEFSTLAKQQIDEYIAGLKEFGGK